MGIQGSRERCGPRGGQGGGGGRPVQLKRSIDKAVAHATEAKVSASPSRQKVHKGPKNLQSGQLQGDQIGPVAQA